MLAVVVTRNQTGDMVHPSDRVPRPFSEKESDEALERCSNA